MAVHKLQLVTALFAAFAVVGCAAQNGSVLTPSTSDRSFTPHSGIPWRFFDCWSGVRPEEAYPALVGEFWREREVPYVSLNAGISGDTSANVLLRINGVADSSPGPLVALAIGANDAFARIPIETIKENIIRIIKKVRAKGSPIILSSMYFMPQILGGDAEYAARFNALYVEIGKQEKVPVLPPLLRSIWNRDDLWLPDHMHPTAEGHSLIAQDILHELNFEWVYPTK